MTEPKTFLGLVAKNYISRWTEDPLHEVVEELSTKKWDLFSTSTVIDMTLKDINHGSCSLPRPPHLALIFFLQLNEQRWHWLLLDFVDWLSPISWLFLSQVVGGWQNIMEKLRKSSSKRFVGFKPVSCPVHSMIIDDVISILLYKLSKELIFYNCCFRHKSLVDYMWSAEGFFFSENNIHVT